MTEDFGLKKFTGEITSQKAIPHQRPEYQGSHESFTKSDTDGEVSFTGISTLTNPVFRLVQEVHRVYFRLRQQ